MWIIPSSCEITPLWDTLEQNRYFAIQYNVNHASDGHGQASTWSNIFGTLQALFDTKQSPYRIVLKMAPVELMPGDHCLIIAIASVKSEIDSTWQWLLANIMPTLSNERDWKSVTEIVCKEIELMVSEQVAGTDEGTADDRFRATARSFRQIFGLKDNERLVNYYSCSMGGSLINQGWMYISEHYLGCYSFVMGRESKLLLELRNITEIRKERSKKSLLSDSIGIDTSDGKSYFFTNLFQRDKTYECLQTVVNKALHRVLKSSNKTPSLLSSDHDPATPRKSPMDSPNKPQNLALTPTMKQDLERERQNLLVQTLFNLPAGEEVRGKTWSVLWTERKPDDVYRGELFLTNNFILFAAEIGVEASMALSASAIRKMEKVYSDQTSTTKNTPYALALTTIHHQKIHVTLGSDLRQCDHFSFLLKTLLNDHVQDAKHLTDLSFTFPSECLVRGENWCMSVKEGLGKSFGFPTFDEKREKILLEYWTGYFMDNGRNVAILKTPFFSRLVRIGLPNTIRGEIWSICSGSIHQETIVGLSPTYKDLLDIKPDERTFLAVEEIEKDLYRSLPEYAAYQCDDGLDALRRVLRSYAQFDPELGYCQAMNIVTAVLLIYLPEESAFWILYYFCHQRLPGYYTTDMHGAVLDQKVFTVLIKRHLPYLWNHLEVHNMQLSVATIQWFLTLFIGAFGSISSSLRVLDCFFLDGCPFLFAFAMAILKANEQTILKDVFDEGNLVRILRSYCSNADRIYDETDKGVKISYLQKLLQLAYNDYFPLISLSTIEGLRQEHKLKVIQSIATYTKKTILRETCDFIDVTLSRGLQSNAILQVISYYYDAFNGVLFSDTSPKFSMGLSFDSFLSFLSKVTTWPLSGLPAAIPTTTTATTGKVIKKSAIIEFCIYLFNYYGGGRKRSERIQFDEACRILINLQAATFKEISDIFYCAYEAKETAKLDYDGIIKITDFLMEIINSKPFLDYNIGDREEREEKEEETERLMGATLGLLKAIPIDAFISSKKELHELFQRSSILTGLLDSIMKKTIKTCISTPQKNPALQLAETSSPIVEDRAAMAAVSVAQAPLLSLESRQNGPRILEKIDSDHNDMNALLDDLQKLSTANA